VDPEEPKRRRSRPKIFDNLESVGDDEIITASDHDSLGSFEGRSRPDVISEDESSLGEDNDVVEKIIGHKTVKGILHYKVHWEGCDDGEDSCRNRRRDLKRNSITRRRDIVLLRKSEKSIKRPELRDDNVQLTQRICGVCGIWKYTHFSVNE
jgi:hypothetical protein